MSTRREILAPLGMKETVWDPRDVPAGKAALGYRAVEETWRSEPMLADGAYGAMGGLITTLPDFARYAAMHLAAWPPRAAPRASPALRYRSETLSECPPSASWRPGSGWWTHTTPPAASDT